MLPSSHPAPINASLAGHQSDGGFNAQVESFEFDAITHRHDRSADEAEMQAKNAVLLASEFSEFISAASRLENSYRTLQEEVSVLGLELSERNAALNTSLAENERMRLALQQIVDSMPCGVLVLDRQRGDHDDQPGEQAAACTRRGRNLPRDGPGSTLRQISASSGVNLEASYEECIEQRHWTRSSASRDGAGKALDRSPQSPALTTSGREESPTRRS